MSAAPATLAPLGPDLARARRRRGAPRPRPDARRFDPTRPGRLPSAHRRALVLVFEAFARTLTSTLAGQLRTAAAVALHGVEQDDYSALVAAAGEPTWIAAVALGPMAGHAVIEVPIPLAMMVAERLLGGAGTGPHPTRARTDLEQARVRRLMDVALHDLATALAPLCEVRPEVVRVEQQAELLQAAPLTEGYAVMTLAIELTEAEAEPLLLTLALPLAGLEPAFEAFAGATAPSPVGTAEPGPANIADHLLDSPVEVALRFGPLTVRAADVFGLREGQLLAFGHRTGAPLSID